MIEKVSREELLKTVEYMTKNFPLSVSREQMRGGRVRICNGTAPRLRSDCRKQEVLHV